MINGISTFNDLVYKTASSCRAQPETGVKLYLEELKIECEFGNRNISYNVEDASAKLLNTEMSVDGGRGDSNERRLSWESGTASTCLAM